MKLLKEKSLLIKYILLYAQAVFLPVLIVSLSLIQTSNALKNEVLNSNRASVALIRESLDTTFRELDDVLAFVGQNPHLSRFQLENHTFDALSTITEIVGSHAPIYDLILTVKGNDCFYTAGGRFSSGTLGSLSFMRDFLAAGYTVEDWVNTLQTAEKPVYWSAPYQSENSYICLFSPVYYTLQQETGASSRSAALLIPQEYIHNLFRSSQTSSAEGILLLSPEHSLLSKLTDGQTDGYVSEICEYIKNNPQIFEDGYAELSGSDMLLFVSQSEETGLCYVRFLPENVAFRAMNIQRAFTVLVLIFTVIIGIVLITTGIHRSYLPIRSLANQIRDRQPVDGEIHDELVLFRTVLDDAFNQKASLSQVVDASRQSLIDHLLADLICGNFATEEAFRSACRSVDIQLDKPYYAVSSLLIEEDGTNADAISFSRIYSTICAELPECYQLQAKDLLFAGKLILVISSDRSDPKFYQAVMSDIKNRLLAQEQLMTSIGMGPFYDSYDKIGKSYMESVTALDYRLVYGKNCLITPDIYSSSSPDITGSYPSYDLELLESALMSRNAEMAVTVLRRLNATVKLKNYNLHIAQYICYDIFSILKKTADFADMINASTLPQTLNITNLKNQNTIDEFFTALSELIQSKAEVSDEAELPAQPNVGTQLVEYIDAHCLSYDFQIKNMAEHFSISPQYMRKLFKAHAGMSVSEYVSNKRLERSMYLLARTDKSLQDITAEIGNSDISGFVRFFKQKTGLTPGQYRKAHRQSD